MLKDVAHFVVQIAVSIILSQDVAPHWTFFYQLFFLKNYKILDVYL